jgi:hypothetical protein
MLPHLQRVFGLAGEYLKIINEKLDIASDLRLEPAPNTIVCPSFGLLVLENRYASF